MSGVAVDWRGRASPHWMRAWNSNARRAIEAPTCLRVGGSAVASGSVRASRLATGNPRPQIVRPAAVTATALPPPRHHPAPWSQSFANGNVFTLFPAGVPTGMRCVSHRTVMRHTAHTSRATRLAAGRRVSRSARRVQAHPVLIGCVQCLFILVPLLVWVVLLPVLLMFLCWLIAG